MSIISDFDEILNFIQKYLIESKKPEFKRHEIRFPSLLEINEPENNNSKSQNAIFLQLVSKMYLLHDLIGISDKLISKCFIKRLKSTECILFKQFYPERDFKIISNVIGNLSDTKYVLVLSTLSYEILNNLIQSDTITKAFWYRSSSPIIVITNNVYQVKSTQLQDKFYSITTADNTKGDVINDINGSSYFESRLLQLLSAVSNVNQAIPVMYGYTFWIFKIENLMFAVLIPRYETQKNSLINVWPILPVTSFFNTKKLINNLKVAENDKSIFHSIAATTKSSNKINIINLKKEIIDGITFPLLIQNKININYLYMTFFFEFLREHEHFQFAMPNSNVATYLKCRHCNIIFNSVFEFVRHWWSIKQKQVFRCHICEERVNNLSRLGAHFRHRHYTILNTNKKQKLSIKTFQRNTNSTYQRNRKPLKKYLDFPKLRQCPYCKVCKEGLHAMRTHLRYGHVGELVNSIIQKIRDHGTKILEIHDLSNNTRNPYQFNLIDVEIALNRKSYSWEQFIMLFQYRVYCPFCDAPRLGEPIIRIQTPQSGYSHNEYKNRTRVFTDWLKFLNHVSRDHCNIIFDDDDDVVGEGDYNYANNVARENDDAIECGDGDHGTLYDNCQNKPCQLNFLNNLQSLHSYYDTQEEMVSPLKLNIEMNKSCKSNTPFDLMSEVIRRRSYKTTNQSNSFIPNTKVTNKSTDYSTHPPTSISLTKSSSLNSFQIININSIKNQDLMKPINNNDLILFKQHTPLDYGDCYASNS